MKLKYYLNLDMLLIKHFGKIKNDVYHLEADNRQENSYAHIFKNGEDILNYIAIDFIVPTEEENMKFCYELILDLLLCLHCKIVIELENQILISYQY